MNPNLPDNKRGYFVNHRSAPQPETLLEMAGIPLKQGRRVRQIIKDLSKDDLLSPDEFPETRAAHETSAFTDVDLLMHAICECVGGTGVKTIPFQKGAKSYALHHVTFSDPDRRSIGFNDDWGNFYIRSLNEIARNAERVATKSAEASSDNERGL